MSELLQDLKFAVRSLSKSPGFPTVALSTLGIGGDEGESDHRGAV